MKTAEEKADGNIFKVVQQLRQIQIQSANGTDIEYHIGHLLMGNSEEISILNTLQAKGLINVEDSWGSNSAR